MNNLRLKRIIQPLLLVAVFAMLGCAQRSVQSQGNMDMQPQGPSITTKGKIDFMKNLGGYFVRSVEPSGEYYIINQDLKVLEELFKGGKTLTIQGRLDLTRGAEYLFIEKIDGKKYLGKTESAPK